MRRAVLGKLFRTPVALIGQNSLKPSHITDTFLLVSYLNINTNHPA
jgi:hypothetical protein